MRKTLDRTINKLGGVRQTLKVFRKWMLFFSGLLLLALGIAFSTVSGIGISPLNSLAFVISEISGIQMGYITMILYVVYVLLEIPIKRERFKIMDLTQVAVAVVFGFFVNWTKTLVSGIIPGSYPMRILFTTVSIVLIAAGTTIYVIPRIALQAPEGLILAICERWGWKFGHVKVAFDVTIVSLAAAVGLSFTGHIIGIREGTFLAALGVGICVSFFTKHLRPVLEAKL